MERSGRTSRSLLAVKRGMYESLLAENARRFASSTTMKSTSVSAGSKSPSKANAFKPCAIPTSPPRMPLSYLNFRDTGRYSASGKGVNFLQKNRQAVSRNGSDYPAVGQSPQRPKIGHAPKIGDALGTPSNKGSSSFMSAGHYGVRDPEFKVGYKRR